jgi:hypothetical protein
MIRRIIQVSFPGHRDVDIWTKKHLLQDLRHLVQAPANLMVAGVSNRICRADHSLVADIREILEHGTHDEHMKLGGLSARHFQDWTPPIPGPWRSRKASFFILGR